MTIYVNKPELDCIIDALQGNVLKSQRKLATELVARLTKPFGETKAGWAPFRTPIKSSWPQNVTKRSRKSNAFYHKPRDKKPAMPKTPSKVLSAEEILASL